MAEYWACAQLQAQREQLALHCLTKVAGFEVYSPRIRAPKRARPSAVATRPLFPAIASFWSWPAERALVARCGSHRAQRRRSGEGA
jgi:hypothetical protein